MAQTQDSTQAEPPSIPTYTLNDGNTLPAIGFGTYPLKGEEGVTAMVHAIEAGYRLLDTAVNYENETEVGEAIRRSGIPRNEVQVASKLPGRHHGYDDAVASVRGSLDRLGLDYLDLQLIHWPNPSVGKYAEAWRALVDLREQGLVRSIGVSNFTETHLGHIIDETGVTPAVNQVELHPRFPQEEMRAVHERLDIRTEAWSPMGKRNAPLEEPAVTRAADRAGVTPGQVILRWHVQLGSLPIPKSGNPERQRQNLDIFGFELTDEELGEISGLADPRGRLFGGDPDSHEEM
jgi:diketogulonate reductase-like aldo/keto reductase